MRASWNRGTPKSSTSMRFSIFNHPFGGTSMTLDAPKEMFHLIQKTDITAILSLSLSINPSYQYIIISLLIYIYNIDRHVDHRRDYQNWSTINPYQWGILIKSSIYELDFPWINHEINHDIHIICLLASASQKNFSLTGPSPGESRDNLHKVTQRGKTKRKLRCTFLNFSILCRISYPDFFSSENTEYCWST
jgi:hypothetical protein